MQPVYSNHQGTISNQTGMAEQAMRQASTELEATFLAEMFKAAGFGKSGTGFGGEGRESEFGTFLVRAYATEVVRSGGIGLAESIFQTLMEKTNDQP